jgi:hypothetical protein
MYEEISGLGEKKYGCLYSEIFVIFKICDSC